MYRFLSLIVVAFAFAATASSQVEENVSPAPPLPVLRYVGTAKVSYSPITQEAISQSRLIYPYAAGDESVDLRAEFRSPGKMVKEPKSVDLIFLATGAAATYATTAEVRFMIDERKTIVAVPRRQDQYPFRGRTRTVIGQSISYKDLKRIANGKSVRLSVGPSSFELSDSHLATFRDLIRTIER
jgi:hypothetical protein